MAYELISYEVDESDLSAIHVADTLGQNPGQIFKTLVLESNKTGYFVCVVPGNREVDLKAAAAASGNKSCGMVAIKELLGVTGYIRGACSPIETVPDIYRLVVYGARIYIRERRAE